MAKSKNSELPQSLKSKLGIYTLLLIVVEEAVHKSLRGEESIVFRGVCVFRILKGLPGNGL